MILLKIIFVLIWWIGGSYCINWMVVMTLAMANGGPKSALDKKGKRELLLINTLGALWLIMWYVGVPILTFVL